MNANSTIDYTSMSDDRLALLLGEFIKHHRIAKNMSQEELGIASGLSRPTISLMERGRSMNLNSIIRVLRVWDLLYLFDAIKISHTISPLEMLKLQEKQDKSGKWRLAPAYDICFAYNPTNFWVKRHALSINHKREQFVTDDFMEVAKLINSRKPEAIISEVKNVVSHWQDFAREAHVDDPLNRMISDNIMVDVE